jgi:hypothetical protein
MSPLVWLWNLHPVILYVCHKKTYGKVSPTFWMCTYMYFLLIQFLLCEYDGSYRLQGLQMRVELRCVCLWIFLLCYYSCVYQPRAISATWALEVLIDMIIFPLLYQLFLFAFFI